METKTIRFEKGESLTQNELWAYFDDVPLTHFELSRPSGVWECTKSFTLTITTTEDGE